MPESEVRWRVPSLNRRERKTKTIPEKNSHQKQRPMLYVDTNTFQTSECVTFNNDTAFLVFTGCGWWNKCRFYCQGENKNTRNFQCALYAKSPNYIISYTFSSTSIQRDTLFSLPVWTDQPRKRLSVVWWCRTERCGWVLLLVL